MADRDKTDAQRWYDKDSDDLSGDPLTDHYSLELPSDFDFGSKPRLNGEVIS